jgi:predicted Zn-ribbon and HTH transcriptional regulator
MQLKKKPTYPRTKTGVTLIPLRLEAFECKHCTHRWLPNSERYPKVCPKCKYALRFDPAP